MLSSPRRAAIMLDRESAERGSVLSSAKTYLTLFKDPIVAANTRPQRLPASWT